MKMHVDSVSLDPVSNVDFIIPLSSVFHEFGLQFFGDVKIDIVFTKGYTLVGVYTTDIRTCIFDTFRIDLKYNSYGKLISFRSYKKTPSFSF